MAKAEWEVMTEDVVREQHEEATKMKRLILVAVVVLALLALAAAWASPPTVTSTGIAYALEKAPPSQAVPFAAVTKSETSMGLATMAAPMKAEPKMAALKWVVPKSMGAEQSALKAEPWNTAPKKAVLETVPQTMAAAPDTPGYDAWAARDGTTVKTTEVAAITAHQAEARIAADSRRADTDVGRTKMVATTTPWTAPPTGVFLGDHVAAVAVVCV